MAAVVWLYLSHITNLYCNLCLLDLLVTTKGGSSCSSHWPWKCRIFIIIWWKIWSSNQFLPSRCLTSLRCLQFGVMISSRSSGRLTVSYTTRSHVNCPLGHFKMIVSCARVKKSCAPENQVYSWNGLLVENGFISTLNVPVCCSHLRRRVFFLFNLWKDQNVYPSTYEHNFDSPRSKLVVCGILNNWCVIRFVENLDISRSSPTPVILPSDEWNSECPQLKLCVT